MNRLGVSPVLQPHAVLPVLVQLDEHVGRDRRDGDVVEVGARLGVQLPQFAQHLSGSTRSNSPSAARSPAGGCAPGLPGGWRSGCGAARSSGTPGTNCNSRHSRRSRAPTPGGSSFCTSASARWAKAKSSGAGVGAQQVLQPPLQIAVGVEVVDDAVGHRPQRRLQVEPAQLVVQIVLQRLRPGDHVGHRVELALAGLFDLAARARASAPRSGRATPRPSSSAARNRPRSSGSRRSPTRALPRWGRRAADAPPAPPPRRRSPAPPPATPAPGSLPSPARSAPARPGSATAESPSTGSSAAPAPASAPFGGLGREIVAWEGIGIRD